MRIITGSARGTNLDTLPGETTRPTTDKVKEAVFSMIQFDIEGRAVLDLFAGSGQLALEALSRGAARATLIDQSRDAVAVITANAKKTHLYEKCRISNADYTSFIRGAAGRDRYDIVFLDPPYNSGLLAASLKAVDSSDILNTGAVIVCECDCEIPVKAKRARKDDELAAEMILNDVFGGNEELKDKFEILKSSLYGRTRITLLTPKKED